MVSQMRWKNEVVVQVFRQMNISLLEVAAGVNVEQANGVDGISNRGMIDVNLTDLEQRSMVYLIEFLAVFEGYTLMME